MVGGQLVRRGRAVLQHGGRLHRILSSDDRGAGAVAGRAAAGNVVAGNGVDAVTPHHRTRTGHVLSGGCPPAVCPSTAPFVPVGGHYDFHGSCNKQKKKKIALLY